MKKKLRFKVGRVISALLAAVLVLGAGPMRVAAQPIDAMQIREREAIPVQGTTRADFTVTFDPADGVTTHPEFYNTTVPGGGKIINRPPDPERALYAFRFWYAHTDANGNGVPWDFENDVVTADIMLWAEWGCLVSFDPDDGVTAYPDYYKTIVPIKGTITDIPADPLLLGQVFQSWAYSYDEDDNPVYWDFANGIVETNITLWAEWEEGYIVYFDPNDGNDYQPEDLPRITVEKGGKITQTIERPVRPGYVFAGWTKNADNEQTRARLFWNMATDTVESNMPLYAAWNVSTPSVDTGDRRLTGRANNSNERGPASGNIILGSSHDDNEKDKDNEKDVTNPDTGANSTPLLAAVALVLTSGATLVISRKKKNRK